MAFNTFSVPKTLRWSSVSLARGKTGSAACPPNKRFEREPRGLSLTSLPRRATSPPESPGKGRRSLGASNVVALNKLYWTRISLGVIAAFAAEGVFRILGGDYTDGLLVGVLVYLASYYLARYTWFKHVEPEN